MQWILPAISFSAEAGSHLPTPEEFKAEFALGGWLVIHTEINVRHRELNPDTVAHLRTNRKLIFKISRHRKPITHHHVSFQHSPAMGGWIIDGVTLALRLAVILTFDPWPWTIVIDWVSRAQILYTILAKYKQSAAELLMI